MAAPRAIKTATKDVSVKTDIRIHLTPEQYTLVGKAAFKERKQLTPWAREHLLRIANAELVEFMAKQRGENEAS